MRGWVGERLGGASEFVRPGEIQPHNCFRVRVEGTAYRLAFWRTSYHSPSVQVRIDDPTIVVVINGKVTAWSDAAHLTTTTGEYPLDNLHDVVAIGQWVKAALLPHLIDELVNFFL